MKKVIFIILLLLSFGNLANSANITLDIINLDKTGAANRVRHAYTGIKYEVPVVVEGGLYPITFELLTAPSGMTISSGGIITWDTPIESGSPHTVSVKVTDDEGSTDTSNFTITVTTSTDKFIFVNGSYSGAETGSITQPYSEMSDFWGSDHTDKIIYFRTGTYTIPHTPIYETRNGVAQINIAATNPKGWLAYPGETVTIDHEQGYSIGLIDSADDVFLGDLIHDNTDTYCIVSMGADYVTIFRNDFTDYTYDSGSNPAYLNFTNGNIANYYTVYGCDIGVDDSTITKSGFGAEFYDVAHLILYGNTVHNTYYGLNFKDDVSYVTARKNVLSDCTGVAIYAQGYNQSTGCINIDISFNFITGGFGTVAESGNIGPYWFYRNTCVANAPSGDGGYWRDSDTSPIITGVTLGNNMIVSDDADSGDTTSNSFYRDGMYFRYMGATYADEFTLGDNVVATAADNAVDSDGSLLGTYHTNYFGTVGWETTAEVSSTPNITGLKSMNGGNIH